MTDTPAPTEQERELADALARHFKPEGYHEYNRETRHFDIHREANGRDSTMHVFRADDGYNAMRSLTFDEIAAGVLAVARDRARDDGLAATDDELAEALASTAPVPGEVGDVWLRQARDLRALLAGKDQR